MSLLFVDSFPYATAQITTPLRYTAYTVGGGASAATIETVGGRFGGRWLKFSHDAPGNYIRLRKTFGGANATICFQFGYKVLTYPTTLVPYKLLYFQDGATEQIHIEDDNGLLKFYRGAALLGASAVALALNTWHQIEVKITIDPAAGSVLVKQDSVTVITVAGINTRSTANSVCTAFQWGQNTTVQPGASIGLSDIILIDTAGAFCNDLLGNRRVQYFLPTADGAHADFTPVGSANHWENVDEIPPNDDVDYNESGAAGNIDTFSHAATIANLNALVDAVVCSPYCKTNDGGAASVKGVVRSGGVDGEGTEVTVPSSYNWCQSMIYVDPNTGLPFTPANFNAAEKGYKRQT